MRAKLKPLTPKVIKKYKQNLAIDKHRDIFSLLY